MGLPNANGFSSSTEIPVETRDFSCTLTFRTTHILELSIIFFGSYTDVIHLFPKATF